MLMAPIGSGKMPDRFFYNVVRRLHALIKAFMCSKAKGISSWLKVAQVAVVAKATVVAGLARPETLLVGEGQTIYRHKMTMMTTMAGLLATLW